MRFLKWNDDNWASKDGSFIIYDKLEHYILALLGLLTTILIFGISLRAFWIWLTIAFLYEIKDGLFTYDGKNIQGFSWKDLIADILGFLSAIVVYLILMRFDLL